jgi:hypothetical protein
MCLFISSVARLSIAAATVFGMSMMDYIKLGLISQVGPMPVLHLGCAYAIIRSCHQNGDD